MNSVPVQLTSEELAQRALALAQALHERGSLLAEQQDRAQYMRQEFKRLERRISELADVVRTGTEWRSPMQMQIDDVMRREEGAS